jgi:hypothetical protein
MKTYKPTNCVSKINTSHISLDTGKILLLNLGKVTHGEEMEEDVALEQANYAKGRRWGNGVPGKLRKENRTVVTLYNDFSV